MYPSVSEVAVRPDSLVRGADASSASVSAYSGSGAACVDADPLQALTDSMEEVSMMFESREAKRMAERKLGGAVQSTVGRARMSVLETAAEGWRRTFPDLPDNRTLAGLLNEVRTGTRQMTGGELLLRLSSMTEDHSLAFAVLDCLEQGLGDGEKSSLAMVRAAKALLRGEYGAEIRAGVNIADEVNRRADSPSECGGLRALYNGEVLGFETPQSCFRSLIAKYGKSGFGAAIDFLRASAGADVQSAHPSKGAAELRRITLDLQCVAVLTTTLESMEHLVGGMRTLFGMKPLLDGTSLTGRVVDLTELAFPTAANVTAVAELCGADAVRARLYFLQRLLAELRRLSSRMFKDAQARLGLVSAAQEAVDSAVESVEDEESREDGRE